MICSKCNNKKICIVYKLKIDLDKIDININNCEYYKQSLPNTQAHTIPAFTCLDSTDYRNLIDESAYISKEEKIKSFYDDK